MRLRATMAGVERMDPVNDDHWHPQAPEEHPDRWIRLPNRHIWFNGTLSHVPERER